MFSALKIDCVSQINNLTVKLVGFNFNSIRHFVNAIVLKLSLSPLSQFFNCLSIVVLVFLFIYVRI